MIVLDCFLIMSYNKVPAQCHYWSKQSFLRNKMIKQSISRNRFQPLSSKMYFNDPQKSENASKTFYVDEILLCLKQTFLSVRSESTFQSIDEAMAKFKGRICLKQYLPLKSIKSGIKLWLRCDASTGYTYDINIYFGKDEQRQKDVTLGEHVVWQLVNTIRHTDEDLPENV